MAAGLFGCNLGLGTQRVITESTSARPRPTNRFDVRGLADGVGRDRAAIRDAIYIGCEVRSRNDCRT